MVRSRLRNLLNQFAPHIELVIWKMYINLEVIILCIFRQSYNCFCKIVFGYGNCFFIRINVIKGYGKLYLCTHYLSIFFLDLFVSDIHTFYHYFDNMQLHIRNALINQCIFHIYSSNI